MTKTILAISIAAVLAIGAFVLPIGVADAVGSFLDVNRAAIITDSSEFEKAGFFTGTHVPTDGSEGAFGYGIISDAGLEAIAVSTTHAGVLDSEAQADVNDPVFHNHYVALQHSIDPETGEVIGTGLCPGLEIRDITFQEPGDVDVKNKKVVMEDVPYYFAGTHSLAPELNINFLADGNVGAAVSFTIDPVDATGNTNPNDIQAVCINDVEATDNLRVRAIND